MADAGAIWFRAFDSFGKNMSNGIGDAYQIYHQQQEKLHYSDALMNELNKTVASTDPKTGKPNMVIPDDQYQEYLHHSGKERAMLAGVKLGSMQMLGQMQKSAREAVKSTAQVGLANARTGNVQARTAETQVDIAQKLGLIPKAQAAALAPTGGQIMMEQRQQRKERFKQRQDIAATIANEKPFSGKGFINDPEMLLDKNAISYKAKTGMLGGFGDVAPDKATHVQLEDGPIFTAKQFHRLQQRATEWKALSQAPAPQVNAPPKAMQMLIQNPNAQMKAFFDQRFGKGAADTVIAATQPSATPEPAAAAKPDADTESPDEQTPDDEE